MGNNCNCIGKNNPDHDTAIMEPGSIHQSIRISNKLQPMIQHSMPHSQYYQQENSTNASSAFVNREKPSEMCNSSLKRRNYFQINETGIHSQRQFENEFASTPKTNSESSVNSISQIESQIIKNQVSTSDSCCNESDCGSTSCWKRGSNNSGNKERNIYRSKIFTPRRINKIQASQLSPTVQHVQWSQKIQWSQTIQSELSHRIQGGEWSASPTLRSRSRCLREERMLFALDTPVQLTHSIPATQDTNTYQVENVADSTEMIEFDALLVDKRIQYPAKITELTNEEEEEGNFNYSFNKQYFQRIQEEEEMKEESFVNSDSSLCNMYSVTSEQKRILKENELNNQFRCSMQSVEQDIYQYQTDSSQHSEEYLRSSDSILSQINQRNRYLNSQDLLIQF